MARDKRQVAQIFPFLWLYNMIIIKQKCKDHCEMTSLQIPCASLDKQYGRAVLQVSRAVLVGLMM